MYRQFHNGWPGLWLSTFWETEFSIGSSPASQPSQPSRQPYMVHPQLDIHGSCRSRIHEQNTYTHFQDWSFICVCRTLERSTPHGTHDLNSWIAWNAWNVWRLSVTQRLYLGGEFNVVFFGQLIGTLHNLLNTSIVLVSIIGNTHTQTHTHTHTHTEREPKWYK